MKINNQKLFLGQKDKKKFFLVCPDAYSKISNLAIQIGQQYLLYYLFNIWAKVKAN